MDSNEKILINAAIESLLSSNGDHWQEDAETIIKFCDQFLPTSRIFMGFYKRSSKTKDSIKGHTNEMGDIDISSSKNKVKEWQLGEHKERIGYYKIWKNSLGHIVFQHYWKSDITTNIWSDAEPEEYHILYGAESLQPVCVATSLLKKKSFTLKNIVHVELCLTLLEPMYWEGDKPYYGSYSYGVHIYKGRR